MEGSSGGGVTQSPRVLDCPKPCPKGRSERGTEWSLLADKGTSLGAEARNPDVGWGGVGRGF